MLTVINVIHDSVISNQQTREQIGEVLDDVGETVAGTNNEDLVTSIQQHIESVLDTNRPEYQQLMEMDNIQPQQLDREGTYFDITCRVRDDRVWRVLTLTYR